MLGSCIGFMHMLVYASKHVICMHMFLLTSCLLLAAWFPNTVASICFFAYTVFSLKCYRPEIKILMLSLFGNVCSATRGNVLWKVEKMMKRNDYIFVHYSCHLRNRIQIYHSKLLLNFKRKVREAHYNFFASFKGLNMWKQGDFSLSLSQGSGASDYSTWWLEASYAQ